MKESEILEEGFLDKKPKYEISFLVALFWITVFVIGEIFRLMHWPYSMYLILLGSGGFQAYCFSWFIKYRSKNIKTNILNILGLIFYGYIAWFIFIKQGYSVTIEVIIPFAGVFLVLFFISFAIIHRDKWINNL